MVTPLLAKFVSCPSLLSEAVLPQLGAGQLQNPSSSRGAPPPLAVSVAASHLRHVNAMMHCVRKLFFLVLGVVRMLPVRKYHRVFVSSLQRNR